MKQLIEKLQSIEKSLSKKEGSFELFALFLREEGDNKWDLLASAPWIEQDKQKALKQIANEIQQSLNNEELVQLSRVVLIDPKNPALNAFQRTIKVEHGSAEIKDSDLFGLSVKHAYVLTSKKLQRQT